MGYRWQPASGAFDAAELERDELLRSFPTQEAAEEWLTLFFDELLRRGVAEVTLMEEDRVVYGPMGLTP